MAPTLRGMLLMTPIDSALPAKSSRGGSARPTAQHRRVVELEHAAVVDEPIRGALHGHRSVLEVVGDRGLRGIRWGPTCVAHHDSVDAAPERVVILAIPRDARL